MPSKTYHRPTSDIEFVWFDQLVDYFCIDFDNNTSEKMFLNFTLHKNEWGVPVRNARF